MDNTTTTRREILKRSVGVAAASSLAAIARSEESPATREQLETVRVGVVGIGSKGSDHVRNLLHIPGVELVAVCDVREEPCVRTQRACKEQGMREPRSYIRGDYDFKRMCQEEELDLVYTATPWRWHVPVCLAAMENGAHAATEIPAAITLDDCWKLVDTSEATGKHMSMMENVNYRRDELMILRMVREGMLGEIIHAEAGYMHDTRYLKIRTGSWSSLHSARRIGNLYPPHGLGPLAWNLDLGRGNRMEYLVSMSSKARGLNLYAKENLPDGHPNRKRNYINGDVNTSQIRTTNGETIVLKYDTDLPRPKSRTNLVQGTRGIVRGFPDLVVSLEGKLVEKGARSKYDWQPGRDFYEKFDHPLWRHWSGLANTTPEASDGFRLGRYLGSGEYIEDYRLINAIKNGESPDFDVYDAADWSVVAALSEQSVANRSRPVDFPDFTRGKWKQRRRLQIMGI